MYDLLNEAASILKEVADPAASYGTPAYEAWRWLKAYDKIQEGLL